ncbi:MAG: hypothetical protein MUC35_00925 [Candidatus Margulisbacteria bacterium]|nr:hypothetical protein [Candidatus Margulisiibacteriota bacterium]
MTNKLLLISGDHRTAAVIKHGLPDYRLVDSVAEQPTVIILDQAEGSEDHGKLFRRLRLTAPRTPIIILTADNDIPLAVALTRLGAADVWKKPLVAEQLKAMLNKALTPTAWALPGKTAAPWLRGDSAALRRFFNEAAEAIGVSRNIILLAEPGITLADAVAYLHAHSYRPRRRITRLDLASFHRPDQESSFWTTVQELLAEPVAGGNLNEEDRTGTLLLENFAALDKSFQATLLAFGRERRGKIDREITLVIAAYDSGFLAEADTAGFRQLVVPPLRQRKDDLPQLIADSLIELAVKHDRPIAGIAPEALAALALYDYPGNYEELSGLLEQAVLRTTDRLIGLPALALDRALLIETAAQRTLTGSAGSLTEAHRNFERLLYAALTAKSGGDVGAVARFLDMPKHALAERLEELRSYPVD